MSKYEVFDCALHDLFEVTKPDFSALVDANGRVYQTDDRYEAEIVAFVLNEGFVKEVDRDVR